MTAIKVNPITNIVDNVHERIDELVLQQYEKYEYSREYIQEHPDFFSMSVSPVPGYAPLTELTFYVNTTPLFAIRQTISNDYTITYIAEVANNA